MFWSIIGLIAVFYVFLVFLKRLGKNLPVLELLLLIAGLQWIVGSFIEYRTEFIHYKYYMYVEETDYMSYVVPAYLVFSYIILTVSNRYRFEVIPITIFQSYSNFGLRILLFALFVDFISPFIPVQLSFVVYLISNLKYIGAIILFYSSVRWHRYILFISVVILIIQSLSAGMFHDLLLWSIFFYMFWAFQKKPSQKISLIIILLGFLLGTAIQSVKSDYRSFVWSGYSGNNLSLFLDILSTKLSGGLNDNSEDQGSLNVRLNQGWIISAIMDHVEKTNGFGHGETIITAINNTLIPRFIYQDKKQAGGRENFMKYTGLEIGENTSMGMSVVGESYANFGFIGGIIGMGLWGLFLKWVWNFISKTIFKNYVIIFFIPLIFFQVIKAETELLMVLNHLIKSMVFVFGFLYFFKFSFKNFRFDNNVNSLSDDGIKIVK